MRRLLRWTAASVLAAAFVEYLGSLGLAADTFVLVEDVNRMLAGLESGHRTGWGGHFPLLQQVPAVVLMCLGFKGGALVKWLAILSLVAFAGLLARAWASTRRESPRVAGLLLVVLLSGPLLWYARASLGEMLAAFFTLGFATQCREDAADREVFLEGFLAGISKETAFPFLLLLGLSASFGDRMRWRDRAWAVRRLQILFAVVLAAVAVNAGFNLLRWGTVLNLPYLNPAFIVSGKDQASFFFGLWFSPNGGVLFFWPSYCLLLVLAVTALVRCSRDATERTAKLAAWAPLLGISAATLGLTLGLSKWAFPMGWIAWGPRFFVPWLPAFAYLLAVSYARPLDGVLTRLSERRWKVWALGSILAICSSPQFAVLFKPEMMSGLFTPDEAFPTIPIVEQDRDYYLRAVHHMLWGKATILRDAYSNRPGPASALTLACAMGLFGLWMRVFRRTDR